MEILISVAGQVVGWKSRVSNFRDGRFNGNGSWSKVSFVGEWNIKFVRGQARQEGMFRPLEKFEEWGRVKLWEYAIVRDLPSWISRIFDSFQVMRQKYNVTLSLIQHLIIFLVPNNLKYHCFFFILGSNFFLEKFCKFSIVRIKIFENKIEYVD